MFFHLMTSLILYWVGACTPCAATDPLMNYMPVETVLSLNNITLPECLIVNPASFADHLPPEIENELRIRSCELLQVAGLLLKLAQADIATAQMLLQRFFYAKSFVKYNNEVIAMGCMLLSSKIGERPRRPRDIINVFHHISQVLKKEVSTPLTLNSYYINVKNQVIKAERRVLKELGFAVHIQHPYKLLICYLKTLQLETNVKFVQTACLLLRHEVVIAANLKRFLQRSEAIPLRDLALLEQLGNPAYSRFRQVPQHRHHEFTSFHLECGVMSTAFARLIYCALQFKLKCILAETRSLHSKQLPVSLPDSLPWYSVFNVTDASLEDIITTLLHFYTRPKLSEKMIEKTLTIAKKLLEENKSSKQNISAENSPNPNTIFPEQKSKLCEFHAQSGTHDKEKSPPCEKCNEVSKAQLSSSTIIRSSDVNSLDHRKKREGEEKNSTNKSSLLYSIQEQINTRLPKNSTVDSSSKIRKEMNNNIPSEKYNRKEKQYRRHDKNENKSDDEFPKRRKGESKMDLCDSHKDASVGDKSSHSRRHHSHDHRYHSRHKSKLRSDTNPDERMNPVSPEREFGDVELQQQQVHSKRKMIMRNSNEEVVIVQQKSEDSSYWHKASKHHHKPSSNKTYNKDSVVSPRISSVVYTKKTSRV